MVLLQWQVGLIANIKLHFLQFKDYQGPFSPKLDVEFHKLSHVFQVQLTHFHSDHIPQYVAIACGFWFDDPMCSGYWARIMCWYFSFGWNIPENEVWIALLPRATWDPQTHIYVMTWSYLIQAIHETKALREVLWQRMGKFLFKSTIALLQRSHLDLTWYREELWHSKRPWWLVG